MNALTLKLVKHCGATPLDKVTAQTATKKLDQLGSCVSLLFFGNLGP